MASSEKISNLEDQIAKQSPNYGSLQVAKASYDFAVDGGTVSTITPRVTTSLPAKALS